MRTPQEAAEYARTVRSILRYLGVCDGNLEEGSMRCDCNVSVRKKGEKKFGTRTELKNINSFRFIEKAIQYEIERQVDSIESGQPIVQETRLYDSTKNKTFSMRSKEEAHDYRYFPEPDLIPLNVSEAYIEKVKASLPELPIQRAQRFQKDYQIPEYDAQILTEEKAMADYYEATIKVSGNPKATSNWIMAELLRELNNSKKEIVDCPIKPQALGEMVVMIDKNIISGKIAKTVFVEMFNTGKSPKEIVESQGLTQITDSSAIEKIIDGVMAANPGQLGEYRAGKEKLFGFFVGQAMKASKGQASPEMLNELLKKKLKG
jgi:aspartyl-tRNA(Asn)/glutamyl-tRNA(Gln) amidotransferase subunit B